MRVISLIQTGGRTPQSLEGGLTTTYIPLVKLVAWDRPTCDQIIEHKILPSGKHTKNYGTSPFLMGKSTMSMVIFNSYVKLPEGSRGYHLGL